MDKWTPKVPTDVDPEMQKRARLAVNYAVRTGKLPPLKTRWCILCNGEAHFYHHESYDKDKWLRVVPMCGSCHKTLHAVGSERVIEECIRKLRRSIEKARREYVSPRFADAQMHYIEWCETRLHWLEMPPF